MRKYHKDHFCDGNGRVISGGTVTVYLAGTTTLANIYSSTSSTTPITGSQVTTSTDGSYEFYVDVLDYGQAQRYKLVLSKANYATSEYDYIEVANAISGTYTISDHKTVSVDIESVPDGVIYDVATGKALTFSGVFNVGLQQVFTPTSWVKFDKVDSIKLAWFGAEPDGDLTGSGTDNHDAIQSGVNSAAWSQAPLDITSGVYSFSGQIFGLYDPVDNPYFPQGSSYAGRLVISGHVPLRRNAYTDTYPTGAVLVSTETGSTEPILEVAWVLKDPDPCPDDGDPSGYNNANSMRLSDFLLVANTAAGVPIIKIDHISNNNDSTRGLVVVQEGAGDGVLWDGIFDVDLGGLQVHKTTPLSGGGSVGFALRNEEEDCTDGSDITIRNVLTYDFDEGIQIGHYDYDLSYPLGKVTLINCNSFSKTAGNNPGTIGYRIGRASSVIMLNCNAEGDWTHGITIGGGADDIKIIGGTFSGTEAPIVIGYGTASTSGADYAAAAKNIKIDGSSLIIRRPITADFYPTGFPGERACVWIKNDPSYTLLFNIEIGGGVQFSRASSAVAVAPYTAYNVFMGVRVDSETYGLRIGNYDVRNGVTFMDTTQYRLAQYVAGSARGPAMFKLHNQGYVIGYLSAMPTSGPWKAGDIVLDDVPADGKPTIWTCTGTTDGTPTDNTGDTTSGSATITGVTDTSDFDIGEYVTVSAGFATTGPYLLLAKTSTTLKINSPATSTASNITVTQQTPVFSKIYSIAGSPATDNVVKWHADAYAYWTAP